MKKQHELNETQKRKVWEAFGEIDESFVAAAEPSGKTISDEEPNRKKTKFPIRRVAAVAACIALFAVIVPLSVSVLQKNKPVPTVPIETDPRSAVETKAPETEAPGSPETNKPSEKKADGEEEKGVCWLGDGSLSAGMPENDLAEVAPFYIPVDFLSAVTDSPDEYYGVLIVNNAAQIEFDFEEATQALQAASEELTRVREEAIARLCAENNLSRRKAEAKLWLDEAYQTAEKAYTDTLRSYAEKKQAAYVAASADILAYLKGKGFTELDPAKDLGVGAEDNDFLPYLTAKRGVALLKVSGKDLHALGHEELGDGVEIYPGSYAAKWAYFASPYEAVTREINENGISPTLEEMMAQYPDEASYHAIVELDFDFPAFDRTAMHQNALARMGYASEAELGNDSGLWQTYHELYQEELYGAEAQRAIIRRLFTEGEYELPLSGVCYTGESPVNVILEWRPHAASVSALLSASEIRRIAGDDSVSAVYYEHEQFEKIQWSVTSLHPVFDAVESEDSE